MKLYNKFHDEIWGKIYEQAEYFGACSPLEFILGFSGAKNVSNDALFKNLLVWFMAEKTAEEILAEVRLDLKGCKND